MNTLRDVSHVKYRRPDVAIADAGVCVYCAGAYRGDTLDVIAENMYLGLALAQKVILAGFAPYIPWLDFPLAVMGFRSSTLGQVSLQWLRRADVILYVKPKHGPSKGLEAELEEAERMGIPAAEVAVDAKTEDIRRLVKELVLER